MNVVIFIGRHGETKLNSEDCLRGWIDVPLNADGVKEAETMGELMSKEDIDRIYCSDLDRADHTAKIVATHHKLKTIPRQWFRPLNYGDLNGKKLSEIQDQLDALNTIWQTDPGHPAPNGESFTEFQDRNLGGLHAVIRAAEEGEQIMIVAHLRNALLFHAVALTGGPLQGKSIEAMTDDSWHLESGGVARFEMKDSVFKYQGILEAKPKEVQNV